MSRSTVLRGTQYILAIIFMPESPESLERLIIGMQDFVYINQPQELDQQKDQHRV